MNIVNTLEKLSAEIDKPRSGKKEVGEIINNLPEYLRYVSITEKISQGLTGLVREYCCLDASACPMVGSNTITLVGILNWLDCQCNNECLFDYQDKQARREFKEHGGWRRFGVG